MKSDTNPLNKAESKPAQSTFNKESDIILSAMPQTDDADDDDMIYPDNHLDDDDRYYLFPGPDVD
jgi:hypothetical protein